MTGSTIMYRFILFTLAFALATISYAEISTPIQGILDNGFRYTLLPLHDEKGHVEIRLKVDAGALDETDKQSGVAHMVEHSVFHTSAKYPDVMKHFHEFNWVRGRNYNAVTTQETTTYMLTPPPKFTLDKSLDALSQMVFHAQLKQEDLDSEYKIIMEEWRQGQGVGNAMNQQRTAAIRIGSRYTRGPVIGTPKSIKNMPATELQDYYHRWYTPNNMQLLIIGDIDPIKAPELIKQFFGDAKAKDIPKRDYYDPTLENITRLVKVQDPRSGVSQVVYAFRFDDSDTKGDSEQARYNRLLDRLALETLTQRLRNQSDTHPKGVENVVVRKQDIGRNTSAVAMFASVNQQSHLLGLKQALIEIERVKKFPIEQEELDKKKIAIQQQLDYAKKNTDDRDFAGWMQVMQNTVLMDKPYIRQVEIAKLTEPMLHKITVDEINQRIQRWLNAKDIIVQYQPPRDMQLELTLDQVNQARIDVQKAEISPPEKEKVVVPMSLDSVQGKGIIIKEENFAKQNVKYWTLSNGDKVVWLKLPLAKDKVYFRAHSSAGFKGEGLIAWQSQLATQLVLQNAPLDWQVEQLESWKKLSKVNLSATQTATKLKFDGSADKTKLGDLLRLYYAYQLETKVKEGLDETKESLTRSINIQKEKSDDTEIVKKISKLRYGTENTEYIPTKDELKWLSNQDLNKTWAKMVSAPVTFYIEGDLDEAEVKRLVAQYLADIPRDKVIKSTDIIPITGNDKALFAMNLEPKSDILIWFFNDHQWQGKDAVLVSILRSIAANKLKLVLRDKELGVYSLRFESILNPELNRIESELRFVTSPEKAEHLIQLSEAILKDLPNRINENDVKMAKSQFISAEKKRIIEPNVWMNRLILSDENLGNPSYLSAMEALADDINLDHIKAIAAILYNQNNQKVFIVTPKANIKTVN
ncbi:M16 family metallopeptidase [Mannheimia massilioguelmaensis]|uniref:M16 family metallopeptidase n=1 Tax=Mannheimia massilioguelmaensis TaxID=1604354 RepID=UPI0009E2F0C7|nr:M16 family metallopeptidase [Mannheimia massilioguelmaensis]